ncbi:hypothetical protein DdX_20385 [Ditylenchus destructor]|uniref:Uncharacterized protein n=1 Tax=Ditylenchus destructor TaxID=166010 RepID=A0AAD4MH97_9BILA|nr:hypothetical protein DdX_20385 [Ditylenchus destructor]
METRHALRRLGVMRGAIHFLGLPDGGTSVDDCRRVLARQIRRLPRLDLIAGPAGRRAPRSPGRRHRARNDGQAPAAARLPGVATAALRRGPLTTLPVSSAAKRSLIRVHYTQLGHIRDDPEGFEIKPRELDAFSRPLERYVSLR